MKYNAKLRWSVGIYYPVVIFSSYILAIVEIMIRRSLIRQGLENRIITELKTAR
jgi:hypothetical protein